MTRTNIDIDDELIAGVMDRYGFRTKKEAVHRALTRLAADPLTVEEALALQGTGWDGDLDELRSDRVPGR